MNYCSQASSASAPGRPTSSPHLGDVLIHVDRQVLRSNFNKYPFLFRHELADSPLFQNQRLHKLTQSLPPCDVSLNTGNISIGDSWTSTSATLEQVIAYVENSDVYVALKRVRHPECRIPASWAQPDPHLIKSIAHLLETVTLLISIEPVTSG